MQSVETQAMRGRLWLGCLLVSFGAVNVHAQTFVASTGTGCQVSVDAMPGDARYRWWGDCVDGKAEGQGALTSSLGGMLRGVFKGGQPYNAHGYWPLRFNDGSTVMSRMSITDGLSMQDSLTLPDALGTPSPVSSALLVGEWTFSSDDGICVEHHTYHADGTATITSGREVVQSAFALLQVMGKPRVFGLLKTRLAANGLQDCSGRIAQVAPGDTRFTYLHQDSADTWLTCTVSGAPLQCFGRLQR